MTTPSRLLAKSAKAPEAPRFAETLPGHTEAVMEAAEALTSVLQTPLVGIGIVPVEEADQWRDAVLIAAWMHDWGKGNSEFQAMVRGAAQKQSMRHEAVTLMAMDLLQEWLAPLWEALPPWGAPAVYFAVAGHHIQFPDSRIGDRPPRPVTAYWSHKDFQAVLSQCPTDIRLSPAPAPTDESYEVTRRSPLRKTVDRLGQRFDRDYTDREKAIIAAVKTTLLASDLAGSALPCHTDSLADWVRERLQTVLGKEQLQHVVATRLKGRAPHPFQTEAATSRESTVMLQAGCGSGKTAAAYLWAAERAEGRRLVFCYPTTATASEGFADYLHDPDFHAILVHSRASTDYRLLSNMPKPSREERALHAQGLEALDTWPAPAMVCTAHTVMGLMENVRRGLYAWPTLAQAAFVFDEVHAYSPRLFGYLLRFLVTFPEAPVLLMTATLPQARQTALEEAAARRGGLHVVHGPRQREEAPRYTLHNTGEAPAWNAAKDYIARGRKVLWVRNTVRRAMETVDQALDAGLSATPFHSRFRYRDRLERQRALIDGFASDSPMLAVTTQVAEMSLDLSADCLVTEHAPIPALIQRLGRLNRFDETPAQSSPAYLVAPEDRLPYDESKLHGVPEWLGAVAIGAPCSQADLARAFVHCSGASQQFEPVPRAEWLDGLWRTEQVRGVEQFGHTIDVLREEDAEAGNPVENAIPMPIPWGRDWLSWERRGRFVIAPAGSIIYDAERGAAWSNH